MSPGRHMRREAMKEMTEFDCSRHCGPFSSHELPHGRCPMCGGPIVYMDGMSDSELRAMEKGGGEESGQGESTEDY